MESIGDIEWTWKGSIVEMIIRGIRGGWFRVKNEPHVENFCWTVDLISWRVLFSRLVSGHCSGSGIDSVDQRVALLAKKPNW